MGALVILSGYFLSFVVTENKISQSQSYSVETYYLTEAGIQETIWKIDNDETWSSEFETNPSWQATLDREDPFSTGQSYSIAVSNTELGNAEIITTGHLTIGSKESQRVVKTTAFQAQGEISGGSATTTAILTDQDMDFSGANINVNGGSIYAGDDINLSFFSEIDVEFKAMAADRIDIPWGSSIDATDLESDNYPPAPDPLDMLQIDFDSDDPDSLLNQADEVYTNSQFANLLENNSSLTLNGVIYVDGNITFPRDIDLTVNGALIADGNINYGSEWWPFWESNPSLTINDPGSGPVGLIAKRNINLGSQAETINMEGLIYALDKIQADWESPNINLTGGMITRRLIVSNFFNPINIDYDEEIILRTLGIATDAPVINIDHWEEEY
ncbi:MAG: hypothetical protein COU22_02575 [Candidatus Komeilibacteria bacterium CG10_big_fil_rev_8_21_14_0_10_41_13]|uniref:Uncharacterized protein n=1 Tax=Candidatus Komeilibacteria bacterium CG10_big_fil_rev_8_21_14_0_10_41_13 TaxID=1974476 RepID=A0A2M6WC37_9BACT|nr:MAG: hypothetical protein COU22_02575 [Candidatus Komeilibacteria bacterium CG10_big_fil_rev_8_21_14_0_10_41_13]